MTTSDNPTIRFLLFRLKLIHPYQAYLFELVRLTPGQLLLAAIESRPEQLSRRSNTWHIGNVELISAAAALYFAIGRTTKEKGEKFNEDRKEFVAEQFDPSYSTHCVMLLDLGVVAIAHKSRLAPTTQSVASRLRKLIGQTEIVRSFGVRVEIDPVPDPQDFIASISSVYALLGFTATFRGPNPIDADELFQKPLAQLASVTSAEKGQVKLQGADLERDAVVSIARSTAATGNRASARVRDEAASPARTVKMEKSPVELVYAESEYTPAQVAADVRARYQEVRGNERNQDRNA